MRISDWSSDVCSSDLGHSCQRPALQFLAPDRPAVGAGTATMMTGTAIAVSDDDRINAAADTAFEKAREQIGGSPSTMQGARLRGLLNPRVALGKRRLLALHRCPDRKSTRLNSSH